LAEGHDLAAHLHLDSARRRAARLGTPSSGAVGDVAARWTKGSYSSWRSLESAVSAMVKDKRIAMEYSAGDAVPYLDRVPAGVIEMVRAAGAKSIASSGELVTQFNATWKREQIASHVRAAEVIATIADAAFLIAGRRRVVEADY
jgi:hypothetical protein